MYTIEGGNIYPRSQSKPLFFDQFFAHKNNKRNDRRKIVLTILLIAGVAWDWKVGKT